jgi:alkanesulfonate monooxygenase SsuD/methylene tetrahydromethanopterin reductase-like flavin-dependent oxidoreductase (luciferase family)
MITANVLVAETDEEAQRLALPGRLMMLAIRTNRLRPVPSLSEAEADPERAAAEAMPTNWIVGTPDRAAEELRRLAADTGADEVMVTSNTHGAAERVHSLELLAEAWGLPPAESRTAA